MPEKLIPKAETCVTKEESAAIFDEVDDGEWELLPEYGIVGMKQFDMDANIIPELDSLTDRVLDAMTAYDDCEDDDWDFVV